ncbi:hypothetical protein C9374_009872 [Naegleria lovaniensis]|uniref:Phospholipid/glycerol acyltransferase domain-containing protein n=1 Tax=Naegleria lovaniensis TaxID=51637 RepID=A0AA88GH90_NAELO|nr:uncharacterized protein C9374_009872 [Naegleria lovaniensis]KAG2375249.1 hypothetical protein C9374_009872 [Naegleria lovaniensis]
MTSLNSDPALHNDSSQKQQKQPHSNLFTQLLRKVFLILITLILTLVFLLYIFVVLNIPQLVFLVALHTLGRLDSRIALKIKQLNIGLIGFGFYWFVFLLEVFADVELEFSGDFIEPGENALMMSNHLSNVDFLILTAIAYRKGMLSFLKYLAKKDLLYIPFLGFPAMLLGGQIILNRNWQQDQQHLQESVNSVLKDDIPCYITLFPEGTRLSEKNLKSSIQFSKERQLRELSKVVYPRVKGLRMILQAIKNQKASSKHTKGVKWVYDVTLGYPPTRQFIKAYEQHGSSSSRAIHTTHTTSTATHTHTTTTGTTTTHTQQQQRVFPVLPFADLLMKNLSGLKICVNIKKIDIDCIPVDDEKQFTEWCYERFYRKEDMLIELEKNALELLKQHSHRNISQSELSACYSFKNEKILDEPFRFTPWW